MILQSQIKDNKTLQYINTYISNEHISREDDFYILGSFSVLYDLIYDRDIIDYDIKFKCGYITVKYNFENYKDLGKFIHSMNLDSYELVNILYNNNEIDYNTFSNIEIDFNLIELLIFKPHNEKIVYYNQPLYISSDDVFKNNEHFNIIEKQFYTLEQIKKIKSYKNIYEIDIKNVKVLDINNELKNIHLYSRKMKTNDEILYSDYYFTYDVINEQYIRELSVDEINSLFNS